jgi:hypothetical protein
MCGFGIEAILEVAHLDGHRSNRDVENLAILCPTCHRMHDVGLIPTDVVKRMRGHEVKAQWSLLLKDGLQKSLATRRRKLNSERGKKAAATRRKNERLARLNTA